jgi:hypothetical protein
MTCSLHAHWEWDLGDTLHFGLQASLFCAQRKIMCTSFLRRQIRAHRRSTGFPILSRSTVRLLTFLLFSRIGIQIASNSAALESLLNRDNACIDAKKSKAIDFGAAILARRLRGLQGRADRQIGENQVVAGFEELFQREKEPDCRSFPVVFT